MYSVQQTTIKQKNPALKLETEIGSASMAYFQGIVMSRILLSKFLNLLQLSFVNLSYRKKMSRMRTKVATLFRRIDQFLLSLDRLEKKCFLMRLGSFLQIQRKYKLYAGALEARRLGEAQNQENPAHQNTKITW